MRFPISIIVPVYNEEKRLEKGISRILNFCQQQNWNFEVIIVEDGSTDRTVEIVKQFCLRDKRIKLISLSYRCGKGGSILHAIKHCSRDNIGYLDIDLSTDPSEFKRLIPYIKEFDVVVGSRLKRGGLKPIQRPFMRSMLSKLYSSYFSTLFNVGILDSQCGFKIFKRKSILPIVSTIQTNGFAFDSEFIVNSSLFGLRIKEVPIEWHHEMGSKLNVHRAIFMMSFDLQKIWINTIQLQLISNNSIQTCSVVKPVILYKIVKKMVTVVSETRSNIAIFGH